MKIQWYEIQCMSCGDSQRVDSAGRLRWLQRAGHLRKLQDPHSPLIEALIPGALGISVCHVCQGTGMTIQVKQGGTPVLEDEAEWGVARLCEDCRQPISRERLEALPEAQKCMACQSTATCAVAVSTLSDENCPRCGNWLHWETLRSSVRTHRLVCRNCDFRKG